MDKNKINIVRSKKGSTLIWVLLLMLVLGILITAGLAIAQAYSSRSITQHVEKQSYYTAYSVTKAMAEWLQGTSIKTTTIGDNDPTTDAATDRQNFINQLKSEGKLVKNVNLDNGDMGTCVTTFTIDNDGNVLVSSKADYEGQSSVVSVKLTNTSNTEVIPGEPTGEIKWPEIPSIDLPDRDSLTKKTNNNWDKDSIGQYEVSGARDLGPNASVTGYIYIPVGSSLTISTGQHSITIGNGNDVVLNIEGSFTPNSQNAVINGNILINGGTATIRNNTIINGDIYLINGGSLITGNESSINGNIYIQDGSKVKMESTSEIKKDIFIYSGGTLEMGGSSSINGSIYIQNRGKLIASTNGEISGNIIVYNGPDKSSITINSNVQFSNTSGIYLLAPQSGDTVPQVTINMSYSDYQKFVHVKSPDLFSNNSFNLQNKAYCTGLKNGQCSHKVPTLPGSSSGGTTGGGIEDDTTITTETWSIGSYTGRDIAK